MRVFFSYAFKSRSARATWNLETKMTDEFANTFILNNTRVVTEYYFSLCIFKMCVFSKKLNLIMRFSADWNLICDDSLRPLTGGVIFEEFFFF